MFYFFGHSGKLTPYTQKGFSAFKNLKSCAHVAKIFLEFRLRAYAIKVNGL
jgi:hypothetical protein